MSEQCMQFHYQNVSVTLGYQKEKKEVFQKEGEWGCACWRFSAGIELDVDLVFEEDDVFIGLDLKLYDWFPGWEEEVDDIFDELLDLQFRRSTTEKAEYKLAESFVYNLKMFQKEYQKKFSEQVDLQMFINFTLQSRGGLFIAECTVNWFLIFERV